MTKSLNFKQKYFDQLDIGIYLEFVIWDLPITNTTLECFDGRWRSEEKA